MSGEITWATGPANAFRSVPDRAPSIIRWEDPPPPLADRRYRPRRSDCWRYVAGKLRQHPDRWAVVLEDEAFGYVAGAATQIKSGKLAAFRPGGSFEAQTRTVGGKYALYVRYVGERVRVVDGSDSTAVSRGR